MPSLLEQAGPAVLGALGLGSAGGLLGFAQSQKDTMPEFQGTQFQKTDQNQNLTNALQSTSDASKQSTTDLAAKTMEGTGDAASLLGNASEMQRQAGALGGPVDQGMQEALKSRQSKVFSHSINQLQRQADLASPVQKMQLLKDAASGLSQNQMQQNQQAIEQRQFEMKQYQQKFQAEMNKKSAENNVLNSVLSLGGQLLGYAIGGNAGAAMGSQAGNVLAGKEQKLEPLGG